MSRSTKLLVLGVVAAGLLAVGLPNAVASPYLSVRMVLNDSTNANSIDVGLGDTVSYKIQFQVSPVGTTNLSPAVPAMREITSLSFATGTARDGLGSLRFDLKQSAVAPIQIAFNPAGTFEVWDDDIGDVVTHNYYVSLATGWTAGTGAAGGTLDGGNVLGVAGVLGSGVAFRGVSATNTPSNWMTIATGSFDVTSVGTGSSTIMPGYFLTTEYARDFNGLYLAGPDSAGAMKINNAQGLTLLQSQSSSDPYIGFQGLTLNYDSGGGENNPPVISLSNAINATIITGGLGTLGLTVTNSAAAPADSLVYSATAAVQTGSANLGAVTPGSGSLAGGASAANTLTATSTNVADNIIRVTVTGAGATQQQMDLTLSVKDHSAPSLTVTAGNGFEVIQGASLNATLQLANAAGNRASLDVNSLGAGVSGATGAALLAAGASGNYDAAINTMVVGAYSNQFSINVRDQNLPGRGDASDVSATVTGTVLGHSSVTMAVVNNNFNLLRNAADNVTLRVTGAAGTRADADINSTGAGVTGPTGANLIIPSGSVDYVGNIDTSVSGNVNQYFDVMAQDENLPGRGDEYEVGATATGVVGLAVANGTGAGFGTALTATVQAGGSLAGLESKANSATGTGGAALLQSTATILAGSNSAGTDTVSMAWRVRDTNEALQDNAHPHLVADVVRLTGISEGDAYVLVMSYDDNQASIIGGLTPDSGAAEAHELLLANAGLIHLVWLDGATWVNAGDTDLYANPVVGALPGSFNLAEVGKWGVDTTSNQVWAILDHNSDFSVVPEPMTLCFLGLGGLAFAGAGLRRRRSQK